MTQHSVWSVFNLSIASNSDMESWTWQSRTTSSNCHPVPFCLFYHVVGRWTSHGHGFVISCVSSFPLLSIVTKIFKCSMHMPLYKLACNWNSTMSVLSPSLPTFNIMLINYSMAPTKTLKRHCNCHIWVSSLSKSLEGQSLKEYAFQ